MRRALLGANGVPVIASRIWQARKNAGLTQEVLAQIVGVTSFQISHYETGLREPSLKKLVALANSLNVTTDFLLGREEI